MTRGATLFSGGGGVEALLKQRIDFVHAAEYDPRIAGVYRQNHGDHIQVARVEDVDYSLWGQLDYLHASPVCKNASQAKTGGMESDTDIQAALAVVRCLEATQPRVFTLENVWGYRNFQAFRRICQALDCGGYMWHFEHLNAADFGVPQARKRLILRAVRNSLLPGWPEPEKWVGWYAATNDILTSLTPKKSIPPWATELANAARRKSKSFLIGQDTGFGTGFVLDTEPSMTIRSGSRGKMTIVDGGSILTPSPKWHARIQSLPDAYQLPDGVTLACEIVGNMVPSLMMQKIVEPLL